MAFVKPFPLNSLSIRSPCWLVLIPCLLVASFYLRALDFDLVWDDILLFETASNFRQGNISWTALIEPVLPGATYFRPLVMLSFNLEHLWLGQGHVTGHAVNLLLFTLNIIFVGFFIRILLDRAGIKYSEYKALLACSLYAMNCVMIESVVWISGRFDLMVTTFVLLGLLADFLILRLLIRGLVVSFMFFCAALSKEMAATMPLLLLIVQLCTRYRSCDWRLLPKVFVKDEWLTYSLLLLAGVIYLAARYLSIGQFLDIENLEAYSIADKARLVSETLFFYLRQTLFSFTDLCPIHPVSIDANVGINIALHAFILVLIGSATCYMIASRSVTGLMVGAFIISLLPVLNIIPLPIGENIGHDRFLALPSVFFTGIFASLPLENIRSHSFKSSLIFICSLWIIVSGINIRLTLPLWANDLAFWTWATNKYPRHSNSLAALAAAQLRSGRLNDAEKTFLVLKDVGSGRLDFISQIDYAMLLILKGDVVEAEQYLRGALSVLPSSLNAKSASRDYQAAAVNAMLAQALEEQFRYVEAEASAREALLLQPTYVHALSVLAVILYAQGKLEEADSVYRAALTSAPSSGRSGVEADIRLAVQRHCRNIGSGFSVKSCRRFGV